MQKRILYEFDDELFVAFSDIPKGPGIKEKHNQNETKQGWHSNKFYDIL